MREGLCGVVMLSRVVVAALRRSRKREAGKCGGVDAVVGAGVGAAGGAGTGEEETLLYPFDLCPVWAPYTTFCCAIDGQ